MPVGRLPWLASGERGEDLLQGAAGIGHGRWFATAAAQVKQIAALGLAARAS